MAAPVAASAVLHLQANALPSAVAAPVMLSAGFTGTTVLGASGASAQTTYTATPLLVAEVLAVAGGSLAWSARLAYAGHEGHTAADGTTLRVCDPPAPCTDQVIVVGTTVLQGLGPTTALLPAESDVTLHALATKVGGGPLVIDVHLVLQTTGIEVRLPVRVNVV